MSQPIDLNEKILKERNKGLVDLSKILHEHKIPFMLSDGVLLGAVREGDFIKWDWDVELSIKVEDVFSKSACLLEVLKKEGFVLQNVTLEWHNYKIGILKFGTKYSLIGFYEKGAHRMRAAWLYPKEFFDRLEEYVFLGNKYMVPSPPENYLKYQYGDWKTPVRATVKRDYLTSEVYRENRYYIRLYHFIHNTMKSSISRVKKYLKKYFLPYYGREANFQKMYESCICDDINIIEIGTSDGREAALALRNVGSSIRSINIIEPDIKNMRLARAVISRHDKDGKVSYHNFAVGTFSGKGSFYLNGVASNLNSAITIGSDEGKVDVNYVTLEDFFEQYNVKTPVLIKMDIEGYEVELLQQATNYLVNLQNVHILLELHPNTYSRSRSMYGVLGKLFENGYRPVMIESAGVKNPSLFREKGLKLINIDKARGLYHCSDKDFVRDVCSRNIQEKITDHFMTAKIARSLLITNRKK